MINVEELSNDELERISEIIKEEIKTRINKTQEKFLCKCCGKPYIKVANSQIYCDECAKIAPNKRFSFAYIKKFEIPELLANDTTTVHKFAEETNLSPAILGVLCRSIRESPLKMMNLYPYISNGNIVFFRNMGYHRLEELLSCIKKYYKIQH